MVWILGEQYELVGEGDNQQYQSKGTMIHLNQTVDSTLAPEVVSFPTDALLRYSTCREYAARTLIARMACCMPI